MEQFTKSFLEKIPFKCKEFQRLIPIVTFTLLLKTRSLFTIGRHAFKIKIFIDAMTKAQYVCSLLAKAFFFPLHFLLS